MSVRYPAHLYVRLDKPLRADLLAAAEARGVGVSAVARNLLRKALGRGGDHHQKKGDDTAWQDPRQ